MNRGRQQFKAALILVGASIGTATLGTGTGAQAQVPTAPSLPAHGLKSPAIVPNPTIPTPPPAVATRPSSSHVQVRAVSLRQEGIQIQAPVTQAPSTQVPAAEVQAPQAQPQQSPGAQPGSAQPSGAQSGGALTPLDMESVRAPISAANIMVDKIGTQVFPEDQAAKLENRVVALPNGQERGISYQQVRWQAANVCHWPLYFEEPMLERHGVQRVPTVIQPAVSGTKFLGNLVMLPYKATLQRPLESRYTLGHFRPGTTPPALRDTLPWSPRAAAVQGAAATGVFVGLPW